MTEEATNKALGDSTFFARDLAVSMFIDSRTLPNYQKKKKKKKKERKKERKSHWKNISTENKNQGNLM